MAAVIPSAFASEGWVRAEGIKERRIAAVATHPSLPDHVYAATDRAVYHSTDGGETWQVRFKLPVRSKTVGLALSRSPSPTLLLATEQALYRSAHGEPWVECQVAARGSGPFRDLRFIDESNVLLATAERLLLSRDAGTSWDPLSTPEALRDIQRIVTHPMDPDQACVVTSQALACGQLSRQAWHVLRRAQTRTLETADDALPAPSDDSPQTLSAFRAAAFDPAPPHQLYLAGSHGVEQSADGGVTWARLSQIGLPSGSTTRLLLERHSPLRVYAGTTHGVALYQPASDRWRSLAFGLASAEVHALASSQGHLWVGTDQGLLRYSTEPVLFEESERPSAQELLGNFSHEPTIAQVQEAAIRYAEVHPDKIKLWRRLAAWQAVLPTFSMGYDRDTSDDIHVDEGTYPNFQVFETTDRNAGLDLSIAWDLGELMWNDDQTSIDTRSKLMVELREEIIDHVTRTYFERRRLQVQLLTDTPTSDTVMLEKELKIRELTALIDGMTGGLFTQRSGLHLN